MNWTKQMQPTDVTDDHRTVLEQLQVYHVTAGRAGRLAISVLFLMVSSSV